MQEAVAEYGGGPFRVPEGGVFVPIDRFSGERLADGESGENVVYEYFRAAEVPPVGARSAIVDGGFAMASDLPVFGPGEVDGALQEEGADVRTSSGETVRVPTDTGFGTISSGGLY
jgi:penicillin-binding protein 1A